MDPSLSASDRPVWDVLFQVGCYWWSIVVAVSVGARWLKRVGQ